ncbi:MAG: hypothetical protein WCD29_15065, partial [Pseudolabrys sp.]
ITSTDLIRIGALPPKHGLSGQGHLPEIFGDALLPAAFRGLCNSGEDFFSFISNSSCGAPKGASIG